MRRLLSAPVTLAITGELEPHRDGLPVSAQPGPSPAVTRSTTDRRPRDPVALGCASIPGCGTVITPGPFRASLELQFTLNQDTFTFPEDGPVQRRLAIDARDYLVHQTVLPHDQAVVGYVSFSSNHLADEKYEYVRYVFIDYQGRRKELVIRGTDVRDSETLFDDDIWK
jgi:hypothetical protein